MTVSLKNPYGAFANFFRLYASFDQKLLLWCGNYYELADSLPGCVEQGKAIWQKENRLLVLYVLLSSSVILGRLFHVSQPYFLMWK